MLVKLLYESWLVLIANFLSEEVLVISSWLSSELVWFGFIVVGLQMAEHSWSHVGVIGTWSHCWEHHGTGLLVALSSDTPAWEDDATEVGNDQEPTLLA